MTPQKRPSSRRLESPPPIPSDFCLVGFHPIQEALRQGYRFKKLYLQKSLRPQAQEQLIEHCKKLDIPFYFETREFLDDLSHGSLHQGIVAELKKGPQIQTDLDAFLTQRIGTSSSTILIVDHVSDPRNLGALSRSAVFFGCDMIVLEQSHTAPLSETVHKTSAGASLLIPYYVSPQMTKTLQTLKTAGYTLICSTLSQQEDVVPLEKLRTHLQGQDKLALLIGNESLGVRPHLQRLADVRTKIGGATEEGFNSLNVSVATGILLYMLQQN